MYEAPQKKGLLPKRHTLLQQALCINSVWLKLCLLGLCHDFVSKVLLTLLKALAHYEAYEGKNFEPAVNHLANADLLVLNEGLLEEADFLVELFNTAFDHLLDDELLDIDIKAQRADKCELFQKILIKLRFLGTDLI